MATTKKDKIGNIIRVKIADDTYGVGRVIEGEFIEFYDLKITDSDASNISKKLDGAKVIFTLSIHKSWKKNSNWEVIGSKTENISPIPPQFMQAIGNPKDIKIIDSKGSRPATIDELKGIERLAVWEDNHVEDRLRDHFANKPNVWVDQLKPKSS